MLTYRVSPDLARALAGARELALAEGSSKVTTRHLLHASLHDPDGAASRVVRRAGATPAAALAALAPITSSDRRPGRRPPSEDGVAKAAHRRAITFAEQLGHRAVDTGHLVYGLAGGTDDAAAALGSVGLTVEGLRSAVVAVADGSAAPPVATAGSAGATVHGLPPAVPTRPTRFDRFDLPARGAVVASQQLARAHGRALIEPAHLAMGALQDREAAAAIAVAAAGASVDALVALLDAGCTKGGPPTEGHLQFAPATKDAITRAMARAEVDGGPVDTAHLLAGVLGDPTLASAVASLGVDVGALTRAVTQDAAPPEGGHDTFWPPWSADR